MLSRKFTVKARDQKQSVHIDSSKDRKINIENNYISSNLKLADSSNKVEKIYFESTLPKSSIYISQG